MKTQSTIQSTNQLEYNEAYGILCAQVPAANLHDALYPTFCKITPGNLTTPHSHFEPEIFFIIKGTGEMTINQRVTGVSAGDLIRIPPFSLHTLKNLGTDSLEFLSIYSEDFEVPQLPTAVHITAAPPTPNGALHLGHISGPYLASDIIARYLRQRGTKVQTHSGTDDHQNYVAEKARVLNRNLFTFHRTQRERIIAGLKHLSITFDEFIEPITDLGYQAKISNFADRAINKGLIQKEILSLPHCFDCEISLVDTLIDGQCPHCFASSRGGCESCGVVVPSFALINPHCARCERPASAKETHVYTFDLSRYLPAIHNDLQSLHLTPRLRQLVAFAAGKKDLKIIVSHLHNDEPGIRTDDPKQNWHVWFEMAASYEDRSLSSSTWIHTFGFDNSFYYLLFIPALLRALNSNSRLPSAVITNEFLTLDGLKFSTSRGHAIWADEFQGNTDHMRLYLSSLRPSTNESDFVMADFNRFSNELDKQMSALVLYISNSNFNFNPKTKASEAVERHVHRFLKDIDAYFALPTINIRGASRRLLAYLDETIQSLGNSSDDGYRIQVLSKALSIFMPRMAAEIDQRLSSAQGLLEIQVGAQ